MTPGSGTTSGPSREDLLAWLVELAEELDLGGRMDLDALLDPVLDLARDAAHAVARPAAPLSAFLVGYASALRGGAGQVRATIEAATGLAQRRAASGSSD